MIINKINNTTINANPPPYPPDMYVSPYLQKGLKMISMARRRNIAPLHLAFPLKDPKVVLNYSHAAPTIINKINNTTINANPPPYPYPPDMCASSFPK
jgi:hypothetical protein